MRNDGSGGRRTDVITPQMLVLSLLLLVTGCQGCILLLNGWEPLSLGERAVLGDIVVTARATDTYKDSDLTDSHTYTAQFDVLRILKGRKLMRETVGKLSSRGSRGGGENLHNISNFGDKSMCYADVEAGQVYLLFLTTFQGRLSAKYDDIFGAASEHTDENEEEVLTALGWKSWSGWTSCSSSCEGGTQSRVRRCGADKMASPCEGTESEIRKCNLFSCKGLIDILYIAELDKIPDGVTRSSHRHSAYHVDPTANLNVPSSRIFSHHFPQDFSVILTTKPRRENRGYLFTVTDLMGFVKLGIQVGTYPALEYSDDAGRPGKDSPRFAVNLSDGKWHQFGYSISGTTVTMYVDCMMTLKKDLLRNPAHRIRRTTVASIGKTYIEQKAYPKFQGQLEQLVISPDINAASQQCEQTTKPFTEIPHNNGKDAVSSSPTSSQPIHYLSTETVPKVVWSEWAPCSTSCGAGVQTRTAYCDDNKLTLLECMGGDRSTVTTRPCAHTRCPASCTFPCVNGGVCVRPGRCTCPTGYYGQRCERASCYPVCYNGGRCVEPNVCTCPPGYDGPQCQTARCEPHCLHGGHCVSPGMCACPYGYMPPNCTPICSAQCNHGGTCVSYNHCKCPHGYTGNLCQNALCPRGCGLGGRCVAPGTCICPAGYTGPDCRIAICVPQCQNGGSCLYPYFCVCPPGTYGIVCEKFVCQPGCEHGGTCIGLNTCSCPAGFSGRFCEHRYCTHECRNGGTCISPTICRCKPGFYGQYCERRKCHYRLYRQPYQRAVTQADTLRYSEACGLWGWTKCTKYRTIYKIVHRTYYRSMYRCT